MNFLKRLFRKKKPVIKSQSFSSAYPIRSTEFERDKNRAFEDLSQTANDKLIEEMIKICKSPQIIGNPDGQYKHPNTYLIICIRDYDIDGCKVFKGEIGEQPWGRPIMKQNLWRKMTLEEVIDYKKGNFIKTESKK